FVGEINAELRDEANAADPKLCCLKLIIQNQFKRTMGN
nr:hypothetical protein [Tanacetum cinerariifolium]